MKKQVTTQQLLNLAAKAAGIKGIYFENDLLSNNWYGINANNGIWNPLEDDAQALSLATKLRLDIMTNCFNAVCIEVSKDFWITESTGNDSHEEVMAATRRAITRAAAEIGKTL